MIPGLPALVEGLNSACQRAQPIALPLRVVRREPLLERSTAVCEIVTCRLADGRRLRLFCKYNSLDRDPRPDHKQGVAYEADVYRLVLGPAGMSVPRFYGTFADEEAGLAALVLECLEGIQPLNYAEDHGDALCRAARWIAQLHNAAATSPFLNRYEPDYYGSWARRTAEFTAPLHERYPWLPKVCRRYEEVAPTLLLPTTMVHGEFAANNILMSGDKVYPIDWETAAIGAGEIDLASLAWGWAPEIARSCELEYQRARWPAGPPADFQRRLAASRLYYFFRWLGDRPEWTDPADSPVSYEELHAAAGQLGLL